MTADKPVVGYVCASEIEGFQQGRFDLAVWRVKTPRFNAAIVLATDYAAAIARAEAAEALLRECEPCVSHSAGSTASAIGMKYAESDYALLKRVQAAIAAQQAEGVSRG